jgi:hypothetical protein
VTGPALTAVVPSGAVDWHRIHDDVAQLAELGFDRVRLGVGWAAMQPRAGAVDDDRTEAVLAVAAAARSIGVELWLTLHDGSLPHWFDDEGGFTDDRIAGHWWPRWVEAAAERFGDHIAGWVPIEDPLGIADAAFPDDPRRHGDVVDTVLVAWRDSWRILRGGPPVATSLTLHVVRPADQTLPAAEAARRLDRLRFTVWLRGLREGRVAIPGRSERDLADLGGSCHELGIRVRPGADATDPDGAQRWADDVVLMAHRCAEDGPDRPLAITAVTAATDDRGRTRVVDAFADAAEAIRSDLRVASLGVAPVLDTARHRNGILTIDRELKDSGHGVARLRG